MLTYHNLFNIINNFDKAKTRHANLQRNLFSHWLRVLKLTVCLAPPAYPYKYKKAIKNTGARLSRKQCRRYAKRGEMCPSCIMGPFTRLVPPQFPYTSNNNNTTEPDCAKIVLKECSLRIIRSQPHNGTFVFQINYPAGAGACLMQGTPRAVTSSPIAGCSANGNHVFFSLLKKKIGLTISVKDERR